MLEKRILSCIHIVPKREQNVAHIHIDSFNALSLFESFFERPCESITHRKKTTVIGDTINK